MKRFLSLFSAVCLLSSALHAQVLVPWEDIDKTGSSLADLAIRSAADLTTGTLNAARLPSTITQATTFAAPTFTLVNSIGSADYLSDRSSTSFSATYGYRTGGALKWYHGLRGIANDHWYLYNNGTSTNAIRVDGTTNAVTLASADASTSYTTGALTVPGGIGAGGAIYTNSLVNSRAFVVNGNEGTSTTSGAGVFGTASGHPNGFGALLVSSRNDASKPIIFLTHNGTSQGERMRIEGSGVLTLGAPTLPAFGTAPSIAAARASSGSDFWYSGNSSNGAAISFYSDGGSYRSVSLRGYTATSGTTLLTADTAQVAIPQTTASTSTTTGALTVGGGIGVGGTGYVGGNLFVTGARLISQTAVNTAANPQIFGVSGNATLNTPAAYTAVFNTNDAVNNQYYGLAFLNSNSAESGVQKPQALISTFATGGSWASNWAADMVFSTASGGSNAPPTEKMRISSSGVISVGTTVATNPILSLNAQDVAGNGTFMSWQTSGSTKWLMKASSNTDGNGWSMGRATSSTTLVPYMSVAYSVGDVSFASTTEATTVGAGAITTAGGIYAAKKIISAGTLSPSASAVTWSAGAGSPEGVVTAPVGSLYSRTDGGAGTSLYVKESGAGNTGWAAK